MILLSNEPSIYCKEMHMAGKEEILGLTNSRDLEKAAEYIRKGDEGYKYRIRYRVINGVPKNGETEVYRNNESMMDSGLMVLDFDYKDNKNLDIRRLYKLFMRNAVEWGVVLIERSISGNGAHVVVRMVEGLTRRQLTRLFELRTGLKADFSSTALSQPLILVPQSFVLFTDEELYFGQKPVAPIALSMEDKTLLEEDQKAQDAEFQKRREQVRQKLHEMDLTENLDGSLKLKFFSNYDFVSHIADIIDRSGIDITYTYDRWFRLAFCLANEFGEEGRDIFHKLSRNHPNYNYD